MSVVVEEIGESIHKIDMEARYWADILLLVCNSDDNFLIIKLISLFWLENAYKP